MEYTTHARKKNLLLEQNTPGWYLNSRPKRLAVHSQRVYDTPIEAGKITGFRWQTECRHTVKDFTVGYCYLRFINCKVVFKN